MGIARFTLAQFRERFPDDDACLDHLWTLKAHDMKECPECKRPLSYKRVTGRRSYQCDTCSHQIYPTAGTIFHKSTTPLLYWFSAIYMFTVTRNGVAAKELERSLEVCYKTALRMAHQIKKAMNDRDGFKIMDEAIVDESYLGGAEVNKHGGKIKGRKGPERARKIILQSKSAVIGVSSKDGMQVHAISVGSHQVRTLVAENFVRRFIAPESKLVTDASSIYSRVGKEYTTHAVLSHEKGEWVKNGYSTNRIENYWSSLKRMIKGTHIHVSRKHFQKYIDENTFRYIHRTRPDEMFDTILSRVFSAA